MADKPGGHCAALSGAAQFKLMRIIDQFGLVPLTDIGQPSDEKGNQIIGGNHINIILLAHIRGPSKQGDHTVETVGNLFAQGSRGNASDRKPVYDFFCACMFSLGKNLNLCAQFLTGS